MKDNYLPKNATTEQACAWLSAKTGEDWVLSRLLECGLMPWFWMDYTPEAPSEIFGRRHEGYQAPVLFFGDTHRLEFVGTDALVTMTRTHDGKIFKAEPGIPVPASELRFMREDVEALAAKVGAGKTAPAENSKRQKLRTMFERINGLDPGSMPGQKIDFHALACAYDKDFQVSPATFSDYLDKPASLPKLCTFGQGAERHPDYYRSICSQIGVTVANYDRAMKDLEKQKASAKAKKGDGGKR